MTGTDLIQAFDAEPLDICRTLQAAGYDAVIVGGPVRDALRGQRPSDVDIATSATPDQIRALFKRTFVQGRGERHGTIGVIGASGEKYEVTTFRLDVDTDGRHATVAFTDSLEEDLLRRDFTINAIALRPGADEVGEIIDPFGGRSDLEEGVLRAVGEARVRFQEDYLRILRAYRFAARFGFQIEPATRAAMCEAVPGLWKVSVERIRDELSKLARQAQDRDAVVAALNAMREDGALKVFLPELVDCYGVSQNEHHAFDVFTHIAGAAAAAAVSTREPRMFFALLLHDIGKPATRGVDAETGKVHFRGHEELGAEMASDILERLKFPNADKDWIVEAVAQHMRLMHAEVPVMSGNDKAGRRTLGRIARDLRHITLDDLLAIRIADKSAAGIEGKQVKDEFVARVQELQEQMRQADRAFTIASLAITGNEVMAATGLKPGRQIGDILRALLEDVIEERVVNEKEALIARSVEISQLIREPSLDERAERALTVTETPARKRQPAR